MSRIVLQVKQLERYPPANSVALHVVENQKESSPHSSSSRISPALLLTTVILAAVFFTAGIVHLLIRYLIKRPSFSPVYQSNRYPEDSVTQGLQRQLQQLFRLHDSGLDQAFVDALPVFCYRDVIGLKDPFDCAVCLCEFSDQDRLRLLPMCSHAFHIDCIDTWLLSNSTCPLCRGSLVNSNFPMENSVFNFDYLRDMSSRSPQNGENGSCSSQKPGILGEKRVFSVRLGKFRSTNVGESSEEREEQFGDEMSSSSLDARRCFSMGAFQYVVDDTTLQVALSASGSHGDGDLMKKEKGRDTGCSSVDGDMEEKKIRRVRGESFSVSKIWLWSKRSKFQDSSGSPASWSLYL